MKSAYEIAMSRLEASEPTVKLTDAQRAEIAEIDNLFASRLAERRIFLEGQLKTANALEREEIQKQIASEVARLEEEREAKKERVRRA